MFCFVWVVTWSSLATVPGAYGQDTVDYSPNTRSIIEAARRDGIDLTSWPFSITALASIEELQVAVVDQVDTFDNATRVDVHGHAVPDWYRQLVPTTGGEMTPEWKPSTQLSFMANYSIGHSIISISSPGSVVYPGNEAASVALARLLNEWLAALVHSYPTRFSFYAVTPLPYTEAAIKEASYALNNLGAVGVGLMSNHEGLYLGNPAFKPFFAALDSLRNTSQEIIFIHPTGPVLRTTASNGTLLLTPANPTVYPTGIVEFYFETARTVMDLTLSQTIRNFTNLHYAIPHAGGAFFAIEDRFLKSIPALDAVSKAMYDTRFWWDSAGPVYFDQIKGLLGYDVPVTQLTFGTDYPYMPPPLYGPSIAAIVNATFLTAAAKIGIFVEDVKGLFGYGF